MFKKIALLAVFTLIFSVSRAFATPLPVYEGSLDDFITAFNKTSAKTTGCFTLSTNPEFFDETDGGIIYEIKSSPEIKDTEAMLVIDKNKQVKNVVISANNRADIDKAFRTVLIVAGSTEKEINEVLPSYEERVNTVGVACADKKRCFYVDTFVSQGHFVFVMTADSDFPVG